MSGFGDLLLGGLGVGGNLLGNFMANQYNQANIQQMEQFQDQMSSTAFQRASTDMKLAGINPIMAYGHPASAPSGGAATMSPMNLGDTAVSGIKTAMDLQTAAKQQENITADTKIKNVEALAAGKRNDLLDLDVLKAAAERTFLGTGKGALDFEHGLTNKYLGFSGAEGILADALQRLLFSAKQGSASSDKGGSKTQLGGSGDSSSFGDALTNAPNIAQ